MAWMDADYWGFQPRWSYGDSCGRHCCPGRNQLLIGCAPGVVTILSTHAPYNPAVNDWPMIYHDPQNTSVLPACQYTVATLPLSLNGTTATGSLSVTTSAPACVWSVSSDSAWLSVRSSYSSGASGPGSINYVAAANTTGAPRTANVTIGPRVYQITQPAAPATPATLTRSRCSCNRREREPPDLPGSTPRAPRSA